MTSFFHVHDKTAGEEGVNGGGNFGFQKKKWIKKISKKKLVLLDPKTEKRHRWGSIRSRDWQTLHSSSDRRTDILAETAPWPCVGNYLPRDRMADLRRKFLRGKETREKKKEQYARVHYTGQGWWSCCWRSYQQNKMEMQIEIEIEIGHPPPAVWASSDVSGVWLAEITLAPHDTVEKVDWLCGFRWALFALASYSLGFSSGKKIP